MVEITFEGRIHVMNLTGKLKEQVEQAETKEEAKKIIEEAGSSPIVFCLRITGIHSASLLLKSIPLPLRF